MIHRVTHRAGKLSLARVQVISIQDPSDTSLYSMPTNYQVVITALVYKSEVRHFSGTFWIQSFIYDSTYSYTEMGVGVLALQDKPFSTAPEAMNIITFHEHYTFSITPFVTSVIKPR